MRRKKIPQFNKLAKKYPSPKRCRQYYMYVTDPSCSRVGTQCWVYGAIMMTEALLCIRHGAELFERTQALNILLWLLCQSLVSVLCVYGCVLWHRYFAVWLAALLRAPRRVVAFFLDAIREMTGGTLFIDDFNWALLLVAG